MKSAQPARHHGQLELTWTNKDKALLSTGDGRYDYEFVDPTDYRVNEVRLLHEVERIDAPTPVERPADLPAPTDDNLLITGDAMHALTALRHLPEYAEKYLGKVKLVYIDPPFNTGQTFNNYEDNIEHSVWLTMMRDRLEQIKELLAEDGSVWVHLDDVEVHRCRAVMDEVFGPEKFVAEVVWEKNPTRENRADISRSQDYLLLYSRAGRSAWKRTRNLLPQSVSQLAAYQNPDQDSRGRWASLPMHAKAEEGRRSSQFFTITSPSGRLFDPPPGRCWLFTESRYTEMLEDNRVWFGNSDDNAPRLKKFLNEVQQGLVPRTWWSQSEVGTTGVAKEEIAALIPDEIPFSTPKPERLLQRIIHIATNPGDIVLDCFAGSGTTAAVAHKMGRRWVTVELQDKTAETFTKPRLAKVVRGEDPGGVTTTAKRVAVGELPDGVLPEDAQKFNTLLKKALDALDIDADEKTIKALRAATKTRDETTVNWHGGGGFTHVRVGESMFTEIEDRVYLSEWAVSGSLTKAMCAQLGVRHKQDGIFAGKKGRVRCVVLDGMVTEATIAAVIDQLPENEIVDIWSTQVDPAAAAALKAARPGSSVSSIPVSVLDTYRRKSTRKSPFRRRPAA